MSRRGALVRREQWWDHKVPPVVGVATVAIGAGSGAAGSSAIVDLLLVIVSMVGVAAFGHLVNDWADVEADAIGGKVNLFAALTPARRAQAVALTLVIGLVPWIWLPWRPAALGWLAVEVVLLVIYSVPPVRLKGRGWLGALADASYAYAVPFALVVALFGPEDTSPGASALVFSWGLLLGLRGILWHQVVDHDVDREAGVETVARRIGPSRTEALVASVLLPVEVALGVVLIVQADAAWLPWLAIGFLVWRPFQVLLLWVPPLALSGLRNRAERVRIIGFEFVNDFVERWLPLAGLLALTPGSWWWWVVIAWYVVVFQNAFRSFLVHDIWMIPDAVERVAVSRGITNEVRERAERREARVAAGPPPISADEAAPGRFVFVVCGPISHLLTLRTAVHHLRPVTRAELWVVTDSSRNEQVIDIEGIDRVVDVATPEHLDHHQASIWLKTSVHRHVPAGEWCYLDSDIIAAAPGVEGVFGERRGPVAFASDVTIRENSVDRFSPWAMTCSCLGYGDQHSCTHLREQLTERFGLDVPGDWLHWNGGVFAFGADSAEFLDMWHERAVASFDWPEWKTRDQGALISTVWTLGLQDLPRISPEFNFIADLGNFDLCLDLERGWAHHPSGPWYDAKLLHLYTSPLEDPSWDLGSDVEAVVMRRSRVRVYRYERAQLVAQAKHQFYTARGKAQIAAESTVHLGATTYSRVAMITSDVRWAIQSRVELLILKARRLPRKFTVARISRAVRARLGQDVSHLPVPSGVDAEPEPQRSSAGPR